MDRAAETGLVFTYFNGMSGQYYFPEMLPGGVALFDYDNDGDLDVFLVQSGTLPGSGTRSSTVAQGNAPSTVAQGNGSRLFRNDLTVNANGTRVLRFTDVTKASGIVATGYGMGAATGDFNNDGWIDLYVTNLGSNRLFRNNGDGTFADVTTKAGADDPRQRAAGL